ncbi:MAG TPA: NAD(P)/FAD-dependent oxidoreductase, partial [Dehalococcoidia bacterium]|nr:NAD(P)/FAD-dependent oxidoreductase [Dehalococcoidia bacterium]
MTSNEAVSVRELDVIVIGAGFGGLYMLHKLRELGFSARVLEMGDGVGGTWYWNRYPGARCDVQSIEYSYSFSPEIEQEWNWTELMPSQPEIERYLNFVADRLDLRRDIQFETKVTALTFDEDDDRWSVETDRGGRFLARFVVAATGCLSAPLTPDIPGIERFAGVTLYTNRFPKEGFDFTGKRVAVVGTGSSGVQSIPVVAEQAKHLYVFQRSAAYTIPANNRPLRPGELEELKADYPNIRKAERESFAGVLRFGAVSTVGMTPPQVKILETPLEERLRAVDKLGWGAPF